MDPDRALVEGLRRGEREALRETYERHGARVYRLCLRLLGSRPDAEDLTQEVFLKLFERAGTFDGRARFSTWIHRLTVNACLHRIEREGLRRAQPLPEDDESPADPCGGPGEPLERREERVELEALLGRLAPEQRAVLVLREVEELSYQEIAEALAIPVGTVMSRLSRARERLVRLARRSPGEPLPSAGTPP
jgi:RNA polymerase sigma-70 factor (ECF subfamily)